MSNKIKITVVGSGYVGMSLSVLLSQKNDVTILEIDKKRVELVNNMQSTVQDSDIQEFLDKRKLNLEATTDKEMAYNNSEFIIVATPTNYDTKTKKFDTSSVDSVISDAIKHNNDALIVIKSTLPVGHTKLLQKKYQTERIVFSPEFLREGQALKDNLFPSRIVLGSKCNKSKAFAEMLEESAKKENVKKLFISSTEAEAIKLFANTYLAMRVSFFNELDSYALANNLNTKSIIEGVCLDDRIGEGYNNPSFGYGGYCLPKDTKQLLSNYEQVPQALIQAIVISNEKRKDFIADNILHENPKIIGIYRLQMKSDSDNFRSSAIKGIIQRIKGNDNEVIIYEPKLLDDKFLGSNVIKDIDDFKMKADLIIANRKSNQLKDVDYKTFSRDLFGND